MLSKCRVHCTCTYASMHLFALYQDAESDGGESILDHSDENDDDSDKDGSRCESLGDPSEMSDEEMDSEQEEDIVHPKASKKGTATTREPFTMGAGLIV